MVQESDLQKEEAFDAFSVVLKASENVEEDKKQLVLEAFHDLCLLPESLSLQKKAKGLQRQQVVQLRIWTSFCDIRPIFNVAGEKIVGAIPYFTLRVEYEDGESRKIDLHLSNEDIVRLKEVVDRAICKREAMESTIKAVPGWRFQGFECQRKRRNRV